jgi:hypothetical protein
MVHVGVDLAELVAGPGGGANGAALVEREVAWERVSCAPAGEDAPAVRRRLGALLDYRWEAPPDGGAPVLRAGSRARTREAALRLRDWRQAVRELRALAAYARQPPEAYRGLVVDQARNLPRDPILRSPDVLHGLQDPRRHAAFRLLGTLTDMQLAPMLPAQALASSIELAWGTLLPEQQDLLVQALPAFRAAGEGETEVRAWLQRHGLRLSVSFREGPQIRYGPRTLILGESPAVRMVAFEILRARLTLVTHLFASLPRGAPLLPARRCPYGREQRGQRAEPSRSAALLRGPFPARGFRQAYPGVWEDVFEQLAQRVKLPLYSDYYPHLGVGVDPALYRMASEGPENPEGVPLGRMTLAEGLDALCRRYDRLWWEEEGALFFRTRMWHREILLQPPGDVLATVRREVEQEGRTGAAGLAALCRLSGRQRHGLAVQALHEWRGAKLGYPFAGAVVPMWGLLTPGQQQRALGRGVAFTELDGAQQLAYRLVLERVLPEGVADPPAIRVVQRLHPGRPPEGGRRGWPGVLEVIWEVPPRLPGEPVRLRPELLVPLAVPAAADKGTGQVAE